MTEGIAADLKVSRTVLISPDAHELKADRRAPLQILTSVIANVAKYNRGGSSIKICSSRGSESIIIRIEDTGRGIAAPEPPSLFEPFKKRNALIGQSSDKGFGLGLPIVKQLVGLMGGTIVLTSTLSVGTTVELAFPTSWY